MMSQIRGCSRKALISVVSSALLLAGCGEDRSNEARPRGEATPAAENLVEVGLTEYAFEMPDEVTGGTVTFQASNQGSQPHEMGFVAVDGTRTIDDVTKAFEAGEPPEWMEDLAGIPVLSTGVTASMTRELEEGQYVFLCFLPTPEGQPHAAEGMLKLFSVTGTSDAPAPEPDLTITANDEGFEVPEIAAGTHTIELVNGGTEPHEFAFISFEPGKSEKDLNKWFGSGYETDAPALFPGGMQSIEPGTSVAVTMTFEAGRTYTLEDFENDLRTKIEVR